MPVTDEVKKYTDNARAQFAEQLAEAQKPLFAVVGAYDVAFEQTRQIPTQVRRVIVELPEQVKSLRGRVEGTATQLSDQAVSVYGELAERGERVFATIRRQPAVEQAVETVEQAGETAEVAAETVKQGGRDTSAAAKKALAKAAEEVEETTDAAAGTAKKATATAANTTKSVADKSKNAADKAVDAAEQATDDAAEKAQQNA